MEVIAAITIGALLGVAVWMMLDRNLIRVVLGVAVFGNGINMLVLTAGRLGKDHPAFVDATTTAETLAAAANPLPQALVLTAIVIGFGLFAFALAVLCRTWETHGTIETDRISRRGEKPAPDAPPGEVRIP